MTRKTAVAAVILVILLLSLFLITPVVDILILPLAYRWLERRLSDLTFLSPHAVKAIAGCAAFGLAMIYFKLTPALRWVGHRHLRWGTTVFTGGSAVLNLVFAVTTWHYNFDRNGHPIRWYSERPDGRVVYYYTSGVDPVSGRALQAVTPDIWPALERARHGGIHKVDPGTVNWFGMKDSRLWFWRSPNGDFEFFDGPGHHPSQPGNLQPVTDAVSKEYWEWKQRRDAELKRQTEQAVAKTQMAETARRQQAEPRGDESLRADSTYGPIVRLNDERLRSTLDDAEITKRAPPLGESSRGTQPYSGRGTGQMRSLALVPRVTVPVRSQFFPSQRIFIPPAPPMVIFRFAAPANHRNHYRAFSSRMRTTVSRPPGHRQYQRPCSRVRRGRN